MSEAYGIKKARWDGPATMAVTPKLDIPPASRGKNRRHTANARLASLSRNQAAEYTRAAGTTSRRRNFDISFTTTCLPRTHSNCAQSLAVFCRGRLRGILDFDYAGKRISSANECVGSQNAPASCRGTYCPCPTLAQGIPGRHRRRNARKISKDMSKKRQTGPIGHEFDHSCSNAIRALLNCSVQAEIPDHLLSYLAVEVILNS